MPVEIITADAEASWTIPPRSVKESGYRVVHRPDGRWVAQATSYARFGEGGEWFTPFVSVLRQHFGYGKCRADAHLVGFAARNRKTQKTA